MILVIFINNYKNALIWSASVKIMAQFSTIRVWTLQPEIKVFNHLTLPSPPPIAPSFYTFNIYSTSSLRVNDWDLCLNIYFTAIKQSTQYCIAGVKAWYCPGGSETICPMHFSYFQWPYRQADLTSSSIWFQQKITLLLIVLYYSGKWSLDKTVCILLVSFNA